MSKLLERYPQLAQLKHYSIIRTIAEGSTQIVLHVKDLKGNDWVLKVVKPESGIIIEKHPDLPDTLSKIVEFKHSNFCGVQDYGFLDNLFYLVTEYIKGVTLSSLIRNKNAFTETKKVSLIIKILQALRDGAEKGLHHLDFRPSKVILVKQNEPILIDFGLTPIFERIDRYLTIQRKNLIYRSAEHIRGDITDHRADIYSVGIVMYEMLTCTYPYNTTEWSETVFRGSKDKLVPLHHHVADIDQNLEKIVLRAINVNPDKRYDSYHKIISDIMVLYYGKKLILDKEKKKKVLIADDEPAIRRMLAKMFQTLDLEVITVSDGKEAVSMALTFNPDLICLDIMMPVMSGLEAAEILKTNQQTKDIPIVMISAKTDNEYMVYSRELGLKDYIAKPVRLDDIRQRLKYWLQ